MIVFLPIKIFSRISGDSYFFCLPVMQSLTHKDKRVEFASWCYTILESLLGTDIHAQPHQYKLNDTINRYKLGCN